jgi:hypothetical protein
MLKTNVVVRSRASAKLAMPAIVSGLNARAASGPSWTSA